MSNKKRSEQAVRGGGREFVRAGKTLMDPT